jgi:hypothetical protein
MPAPGITVGETVVLTGKLEKDSLYPTVGSDSGSGRIFNLLTYPGSHVTRVRCQFATGLLVSIIAFLKLCSDDYAIE